MVSLATENDPANRVIQFPNFFDTASWPRCSSDYACVFEALQIIGLALHGQEWDGSELQSVFWPVSPRKKASETKILKSNERILNARTPVSIARPVTLANILDGKFDVAKQQFAHVSEYYLEQRQIKWERNVSAYRRLHDAVEWLAQHCRDGQIQSFARRTFGGELSKMENSEWNIENPLAKFISFGGGTRYFHESIGNINFYLFFRRDELDRATALLQHKVSNVAPIDLARLSPFLQFAVKLAFQNNYVTNGATDTVATREAIVTAAWNEGFPDIPCTNTNVKMLAAMMGFPDRAAIERGISGGLNGKKRVTPKKG